jgi:tRNA nucleotidyltransferase (CCA-adding enzyme)
MSDRHSNAPKDMPKRRKLTLKESERELFWMLKKVVNDNKLNTTLRVAGGWVRDKLLNIPGKNDIDIAIEGMTGVTFARHWQSWFKPKNKDDKLCVHIVKQNPDRSKHLETGKSVAHPS